MRPPMASLTDSARSRACSSPPGGGGVQAGHPDPHVVALAGEPQRHLAGVQGDHVGQEVVEELLHRAGGEALVGAVVDEDPDRGLVGHAVTPALPDLGGECLQVDLRSGHQGSLA